MNSFMMRTWQTLIRLCWRAIWSAHMSKCMFTLIAIQIISANVQCHKNVIYTPPDAMTLFGRCVYWVNIIIFVLLIQSCLFDHRLYRVLLTLKAPITTAADDIFFFRENNAWHFMWIICRADDSHEMSRLPFSEKKRMSSATNFAWRFKG